jgi:hypothetical protein
MVVPHLPDTSPSQCKPGLLWLLLLPPGDTPRPLPAPPAAWAAALLLQDPLSSLFANAAAKGMGLLA